MGCAKDQGRILYKSLVLFMCFKYSEISCTVPTCDEIYGPYVSFSSCIQFAQRESSCVGHLNKTPFLTFRAVALGSLLSRACREASSDCSDNNNKAIKHVAAPGKFLFCSRGSSAPDKGNMLFSVLLQFLLSRWSVSRRLCLFPPLLPDVHCLTSRGRIESNSPFLGRERRSVC